MSLSEAQRDGRACICCGTESGPMRPVSDGSILFACDRCMVIWSSVKREAEQRGDFIDVNHVPWPVTNAERVEVVNLLGMVETWRAERFVRSLNPTGLALLDNCALSLRQCRKFTEEVEARRNAGRRALRKR